MLRTTDVARILQLDPATVRRMITDGRLPASRPGRGYRVTQADLDAFLERRRVSTPITTRPVPASPVRSSLADRVDDELYPERLDVHPDSPTYCGSYPTADHAACPSSIECTSPDVAWLDDVEVDELAARYAGDER
jgi:excisionase family DNA binding protein